MFRRLLFAIGSVSLLATGCGSAPTASAAAAATPSCAPRPIGSPPAGFTPGQGGFGDGSRPVATGQVDSFSNGLLTVSDRRTGLTRKITVTSSTEVTTGFGGRGGTATPAPAKLTKGENVTVFGSQAADGSITATRISVLPSGSQLCARGPRTRPSSTPQG